MPNPKKVSELTARQALHACHLLRNAYDRGDANNAHIDWDDVDAAHEQAIKALKMAKEF